MKLTVMMQFLASLLKCRTLARRTKLGRSGTAALEFALIMPIFALFLMAIFEFGRLFWIQVSLRQAVEQAARYALAEYTRQSFSQPSALDFQNWFTTWGSSLTTIAGTEVYGWDPSAVTWSATPSAVLGAPGGFDTITVSGSYDFQFALIIVPGWTNQTLDASATTPVIGARTSYVPP